MAKALYIGVGGTARKGKKAYIGINGVARKVKKMYIGVNGVARLFWSGQGSLSYYGTATALGVKRRYLAGASTPTHAIFAGGRTNSTTGKAEVDGYNASLTRSGGNALTKGRERISSANIGEYAIFAGGYLDGPSYNYVCKYNSALTKSTDTLTSKTNNAPSASINNSAMFQLSKNSMDIFNSGLTKSNRALTYPVVNVGWGASIGKKYAVFIAAGNNNAFYINESLTEVPLSISNPFWIGAVSISANNYCIFGGGKNTGLAMITNTLAYTSTLTQVTPSALSVARITNAGASADDYAIFAGGFTSTSKETASYASGVADAYDGSITKVSCSNLSVARGQLAGASINNFILFAGGYEPASSQVVDVYQSK